MPTSTHARRTRPTPPHPRSSRPEGVFRSTTRAGRAVWYVRLIATGFEPRLYRYESQAEAEEIYAKYQDWQADLFNDLGGDHTVESEDAPSETRVCRG